MKHYLVSIGLLLLATAVSVPAIAYDAELAKSYDTLFANCKGAQAGKALHMMEPEALVQALKKGEKLVALDIRTPAETGVFGVTMPETIVVSIDELFEPEQLARIPTDRKVVVFCQTGARSVAACTALRHVGFDNAFILKGGLKGLSAYLGPKEAY